MRWFLRKDLPWIVGGAAAGTTALTLALHSESFSKVFVFGADRLEAAFHVAWIGGLLLGAVAGCFDEMLGTREFLAQRPIDRRAVTMARLRGVLAALAGWAVVAPIVAWIGFALYQPGLESTRLEAAGSVLATFVVAASSAGVGLAAASIPAAWWLRLLAAGVWFVATFALVHALATRDDGTLRMAVYVAGHVAAAVVFFAIATVAAAHDADADRPWTGSLRWAVVLPVLVAAAALWSALLGEAQGAAVKALERAYPRVVKHGEAFVLVQARDHSEPWLLVDGEHRPTGETLDVKNLGVETWGRQWRWFGSSLYFEEPRWHRGPQHESVGGVMVTLTNQGLAWFAQPFATRRTGRGPDHASFSPGSTLGAVGDVLVVVDAASGVPWRFDGAAGHFRAIAVPSGEFCERVERLRLDDGEKDPEILALFAQPDAWRTPSFVRGQRDGYLVRDGALVAVPGLLERVERGKLPVPRITAEDDPLVYELGLPADGSPVRFTHEFRPRTAHERLHAFTAIVESLLRPAVLQVTGSFGPMPRRASWLFDRLTVDGRRPWLVFAVCLIAGLTAWRFGRRLRVLGADQATVWWWRCAVVCFGPAALTVGFVVERSRRYARHDTGSVPEPRLRSPQAQEVA